MRPNMPETLRQQFHNLYFQNLTWQTNHWLGHKSQKCPLDLWMYHEIIFETQPDVIVELGTLMGGTTLFLANLFDLMHFNGQVVSVDNTLRDNRPVHPRITYIHSDSVDPQTIERIRSTGSRRMVIADSDHSKQHVLRELKAYHELVASGCYYIVEDTNHKWLHPGSNETPMDGVDEFLSQHQEFQIDPSRERHFLTFNPRGYLKKR